MNKLVIVSQNYPSRFRPNSGAFVYNLVQELAKIYEVHVIAPVKLNEIFIKTGSSYGKEAAKIHRPIYVSFGNKKLPFTNLKVLSDFSLKTTITRTFHRKIKTSDAIYAHFIYNGLFIYSTARKMNIPLILASGESTFRYFGKSARKVSEMCSYISHIVCVSKLNYEYFSQQGCNANKMSIIPNAVDYDTFAPLDKITNRRKRNISQDAFVVGFIGRFIEGKGPNRLISAISFLDDADIQLICVGDGEKLKNESFLTVIPPVPNGELPEIISCFDIFVLPTLSEGHCNVIEEVKACCVPIISSSGTTVETQIDTSIGLLVNPRNIREIAAAISYLKSNPKKRSEMAANLLNLRYSNSLTTRARRISELIDAGITRNK